MRQLVSNLASQIAMSIFLAFLAPLAYRWIIFWTIREKPRYRKLILPIALGCLAATLLSAAAGLSVGWFRSVAYYQLGDGVAFGLMFAGITVGLWLFQGRYLSKKLSFIKLAAVSLSALGLLYMIFLIVAGSVFFLRSRNG